MPLLFIWEGRGSTPHSSIFIFKEVKGWLYRFGYR